MTRIDYDSGTGRPILVAPERRVRPLHTVKGKDGADVCPFCPGHEDETPPETDAAREPGTRPNTPGWRVRAFQNKYPAADWHEVVAEGPEHQTRPADVPLDIWQDVVPLWRRRMLHFEAQDDVRCAFLFKNVGRIAGASVAHVHTQILGLPILPPRLETELQRERERGSVVMAELENAEDEGRIVHRSGDFVIFCPRHPKLPFETWYAPTSPDIAFEDPSRDADLAHGLWTMFCAIDSYIEGQKPAFNCWLHRIPGEEFHWHFEFQPRTGFMAGLELGGDMYINAVSPSDAAATLREGLRRGG